ncbi:MAG TPA: hypothetical protein VKD04_06210, partial [Burkholderiales bacterium]|nr:hypothetical protein [Burkholderiales bacterium]
MLRPIPPHMAWQAMTAWAGVFTLVSALAAPVDLWRLTVKSRQGEPFRATATLASLPEEHISSECLSMGPESDAPGSDVPFLSRANLKLDASRNAVEISTDESITAPALALVLRVQCAGAPLYARHFTALIAPAMAKPQEHPAAGQPQKQRGFRLSLLRGDSVESVAAVIFPGKRSLQQRLVERVIAGNPNAFPNGRSRKVPAGTVLWFPDLRDLRKSSRAISSSNARSASPSGKRRSGRSVDPQAGVPPSAGSGEETPARRDKPVTLRRALELGDRPGPQECKQLMQLCGAEPVTQPSPALDDKARALETGVNALHLKQDSIDQQLQRLEQSLQAVQKTIGSAPAAGQPVPTPPRVEIRTVVRSEPFSWTIWLGLAGLIVAAAIGGFIYGRRGSVSRGLAETDEQLDRMLATAATVMREFESAPKSDPAPRMDVPMPPPTPRLPLERAQLDKPAAESAPAAQPAPTPGATFDTQGVQTTPGVDVELESEPPTPPEVAGLSTDVLYEMDQALDNTRSMFTDVDRFIALGRTQNALSLLQFQVHKDP